MFKPKDKFDKYERQGAYHWKIYTQKNRDYRKRVDALVKLFNERGTILDIGCGDGLISHKLLETKRFSKVVGIDNNYKAIELANEKKEAFGKGDDLSFSHKAFSGLSSSVNYDFIVAHEVIEHIPQPEVLLKVIHSRMNKFAIITTPNSMYNKPDVYDYNLWSKKGFEELLSSYKYEFITRGKFLCVKLIK